MRIFAPLLLVATGLTSCVGGSDPSPAEQALIMAAPEEHAAWRAAAAALEAARQEAGSAVEGSRVALAAAEADEHQARAARDDRTEQAEALLAAELERLSAWETEEKQRGRSRAEAAMEVVFLEALEEATRVYSSDFAPCASGNYERTDQCIPAGSASCGDRGRPPCDLRFFVDVLLRERSEGWRPVRGRNVHVGAKLYQSAYEEAFTRFSAIEREANTMRRTAQERVEAEKAEAQRAYETLVGEAQARYDATVSPSVAAFHAAQASELAARNRVAAAAPEAWAAFAAALEAER